MLWLRELVVVLILNKRFPPPSPSLCLEAFSFKLQIIKKKKKKKVVRVQSTPRGESVCN